MKYLRAVLNGRYRARVVQIGPDFYPRSRDIATFPFCVRLISQNPSISLTFLVENTPVHSAFGEVRLGIVMPHSLTPLQSTNCRRHLAISDRWETVLYSRRNKVPICTIHYATKERPLGSNWYVNSRPVLEPN